MGKKIIIILISLSILMLFFFCLIILEIIIGDSKCVYFNCIEWVSSNFVYCLYYKFYYLK